MLMSFDAHNRFADGLDKSANGLSMLKCTGCAYLSIHNP